jgi:hypothetical protein
VISSQLDEGATPSISTKFVIQKLYSHWFGRFLLGERYDYLKNIFFKKKIVPKIIKTGTPNIANPTTAKNISPPNIQGFIAQKITKPVIIKKNNMNPPPPLESSVESIFEVIFEVELPSKSIFFCVSN